MQENRIKEIIEIAEGVNREECSLNIDSAIAIANHFDNDVNAKIEILWLAYRYGFAMGKMAAKEGTAE